MKRINLLLALLLVSLILPLYAQKMNDMIDLEHYAEQNRLILASGSDSMRVVFMGNSITEGWIGTHPHFFTSNHYLCRGISGQTSTQMLLRFRPDVIDLKPVAVLINAGTNDIAENTGKYNIEFTFSNIRSMAELALANGIIPIMSSVLPVKEYWWDENVKDVPTKIDELNKRIRSYADENNLLYVDYNSTMRDSDGGLLKSLANDGVHPNASGYDIMEAIVKPFIDKALLSRSR